MARPRKTLPANGLNIIRQAASNGCAETQIARALGVTFKTWKRIRDEDPAAREVWEEARAIEEEELVGILMRAARGTRAEYDADGNVVQAERPPYIPAAMFLGKARHGWREQGDPSPSSATAAVQILMPAQLPLDQIRSLMGQGAVINQPALVDRAA